MALAVDVIDRRGPSNKMHRHLEPKKTMVMLYIRVYNSNRCFTRPSLLTRGSTLVLNVGMSQGWKMTKCAVSYSQRRVR